MATVYDTRRKNLIAKLTEPGAKTQLALKLGWTQAAVSHLLRDPAKKGARPIHEDAARDIENKLHMARGELDRDADSDRLQEAALLARALDVVNKVAAEMKLDLPNTKIMEAALIARDADTVTPGFVRQLLRFRALG